MNIVNNSSITQSEQNSITKSEQLKIYMPVILEHISVWSGTNDNLQTSSVYSVGFYII